MRETGSATMKRGDSDTESIGAIRRSAMMSTAEGVRG
jgi:hypothetical protein